MTGRRRAGDRPGSESDLVLPQILAVVPGALPHHRQSAPPSSGDLEVRLKDDRVPAKGNVLWTDSQID